MKRNSYEVAHWLKGLVVLTTLFGIAPGFADPYEGSSWGLRVHYSELCTSFYRGQNSEYQIDGTLVPKVYEGEYTKFKEYKIPVNRGYEVKRITWTVMYLDISAKCGDPLDFDVDVPNIDYRTWFPWLPNTTELPKKRVERIGNVLIVNFVHEEYPRATITLTLRCTNNRLLERCNVRGKCGVPIEYDGVRDCFFRDGYSFAIDTPDLYACPGAEFENDCVTMGIRDSYALNTCRQGSGLYVRQGDADRFFIWND